MPFELKRLVSTIEPLLGRVSSDSELEAFLTELGHWPLPPFQESMLYSLYLEHKADGFCLVLKPASQPFERRSPARFEGCFFHSAAEAGYSAFAHPLPGGVSFGEANAAVVARLGAPANQIDNKKTGRLMSQRWELSSCSVSVGYDKAGCVKQVYLAQRSP